jgi:OmpA-OmpF porin, OOP family
MNKPTLAVIGITLFGFSAAAPVAIAADVGPYIGFSVGQAKARDLKSSDIDAALASIGLGSVTSVDDKDTAFRIYGGYRILENLAVEVAYVDYGAFKSNSTIVSGGFGTATGKWSGYHLSGSAVGILPVGQNLLLFGKAGLGYWNLDFDFTASGPGGTLTASDSDSGISPLLGIGAVLNFTQNFGIRAEWERHLNIGDDNTTGESDIDILSLGLQFSF